MDKKKLSRGMLNSNKGKWCPNATLTWGKFMFIFYHKGSKIFLFAAQFFIFKKDLWYDNFNKYKYV